MKISVILTEIRDTGNLGAIARLCDNFAVQSLILVDPQCDVFADHVYQRATRARKYIDEIVICQSLQDVDQYVDYKIALTGRTSQNPKLARNLVNVQDLSNELAKFSQGIIGLVFGRENIGLTNEELLMCDVSATIRTPSSNNILNLSHAVAVVLHEFTRLEFNQVKNNSISLMSSEHKNALFKFMQEILESSKLPEHYMESSLALFQSIIGRTYMSQTEMNGLLGIFRAISKSIVDDDIH